MAVAEKKRANSVLTVQELAGKSIDGKSSVLRFKVLVEAKDGIDPIYRELDFDIGKTHVKNRELAETFGWKQRLSDRAAIPCDVKTGKRPSAEEKFAAIKELADWYMSGTEEWRFGGTGERAERGTSDLGLLRECLGELRADRTSEQIAEFVKKLTKEQVKALLLRQDVAEIAQRIQSANAKVAAVDTDELMEGF